MLYDTVAVRGIAKNGPIDKYNATKNASEKIGWIFSSNSFLKPRKMRGQISQGMILSAEKDGVLQVVFAPEGMPNGSTVA